LISYANSVIITLENRCTAEVHRLSIIILDWKECYGYYYKCYCCNSSLLCNSY